MCRLLAMKNVVHSIGMHYQKIGFVFDCENVGNSTMYILDEGSENQLQVLKKIIKSMRKKLTGNVLFFVCIGKR